MKRITNYQLRESLQNEYRTTFSGKYASLFDILFKYIWRSLPLGLKLLVRRNIGSMTFSWGMIFFAAVWTRFILEGFPSVDENNSITNWADNWEYVQDYRIVVNVLSIIGVGLMKFLYCIIDFIPFSIINNEELHGNIEYFYPSFLSLVVLLAGSFHKDEISKKHKQKKPFDPLHHGDSIFILGLYSLFSIVGIPKKELEALKEQERVIEIVILGVLTYILWLFSSRIPFFNHLTLFFLVGTIAFWLENRSVKQQLNREVETQMAMEYRTKKIQEAYQKYYNDEVDEVATVSAVSSSERIIRSHPIRSSNGASVGSI